VDESPEQVLARLARHRDAVFQSRGLPVSTDPRPSSFVSRQQATHRAAPTTTTRSPSPAAAAAAPVAVWDSDAAASSEFIPPGIHRAGSGWRLSQSAVLVTIFGLLLAATAAAVAVLAFERLSTGVALGIVGIMGVGGLVAATRRVPTAMWWTIGALIGGALGRWS
jgi:hypothetical protein